MPIGNFYVEGNNQFQNGEFSSQIWAAPHVASPAFIREILDSFQLIGRRVRRMKMIGLAYNLVREWLEESAYNALEGLSEEELQERSSYENISPEMEFIRFAEIDEPLLIEFEDGDVFEIDTPQTPEYRIGMNCIPWDIGAGTNLPNADANTLFGPALQKKVVSLEIKTFHADYEPTCYTTFHDDLSSRELVSGIILWLENDIGIRVEGWMDFCHVSLVDRAEETLPISFRELKPALFNWEDRNGE